MQLTGLQKESCCRIETRSQKSASPGEIEWASHWKADVGLCLRILGASWSMDGLALLCLFRKTQCTRVGCFGPCDDNQRPLLSCSSPLTINDFPLKNLTFVIVALGVLRTSFVLSAKRYHLLSESSLPFVHFMIVLHCIFCQGRTWKGGSSRALNERRSRKRSIMEGIPHGENCMKQVTKAGMHMPDFRVWIKTQFPSVNRWTLCILVKYMG